MRLFSDFYSILFYVHSVFRLNGLYVSILFGTAWYVARTWIAGAVAALLFIVNLEDTTRVHFTVNLRESFAIPFFVAQICLISMYLDRQARRSKSGRAVLGFGIFATSFFFAICWQFNQFVFLLQTGALYIMSLLQLAPIWQLRNIMLAQAAALLAVCCCQFSNPMILGSLSLCFIAAAIISSFVFRSAELSGTFVLGMLYLPIAVGGGQR